jgi:hypothetical protein
MVFAEEAGQMKRCRFCAEEIQDAATVCKHCGRDLIPGQSTAAGSPTTQITGVDPFAEEPTSIRGKKAGRITGVGYLGIGLGVLMILFGSISQDDGFGPFMLGLFGAVAAIGSYLRLRR